MCSQGNVQSGKYPLGEMSGRRNVKSEQYRSGNCPVGDVSVGEVSVGEKSSQGSVQTAFRRASLNYCLFAIIRRPQ